MNGKKIMLTGLSTQRWFSASLPGFSPPRHHRPRIAPRILFVQMLETG